MVIVTNSDAFKSIDTGEVKAGESTVVTFA